MKNRERLIVISITACLAIFLLLLGPFLWSTWIGELPNSSG